MSWRDWLQRKPIDAQAPPPAPLPHAFPSVEQWLRAWVAHRLQAYPEQARTIATGRAVGLVGSLGLDSWLDEDGTAWVELEDNDGRRAPPRPAMREEAASLFITAATRYPALALLIPFRPAEAVTCGECGGSGQIAGIAPCLFCGKRGWTAPGWGPTPWGAPWQAGQPD